MGVEASKSLLKKIARAFAAGRVSEQFLFRASELYVKAKAKARDSRDKWKIRKRLGT